MRNNYDVIPNFRGKTFGLRDETKKEQNLTALPWAINLSQRLSWRRILQSAHQWNDETERKSSKSPQ